MSFNFDFFVDTFFLALTALPTTLKIAAITLLISIPLGFLLAVVRINKIPFLAKLGAVYVSFIRGTPIVIQILIIYSMVPSLLDVFLKSMNSSINVFDINPILYAYIVFSLNTIAILSEVFRSALFTVNKGQLEAAQAIGLTSFQSYRRIIIPQALISALPNLCTATMNLIKATSLAFLMTVKDITAIAKVEAGFGYNYIEAYLDVWIIYLVVCSIVEILFNVLEKNLKSYKTAVG
ncbi:amino acid ABC transporter permease [Bacillus sp. FSL K6-3431]|uniref:amino acid ABC transporter permease n=1 Tax=Bacillus sp. FSL K6-3431 TaxID=2921500 RepID=UPI0030F7A54B